MRKRFTAAWGVAALALFVGFAGLWRAGHRGGPSGRAAPPVVRAPAPLPAEEVPAPFPERMGTVLVSAAVPEGGEDSRRTPVPGSARGYRESFRARAAADPSGFAALARGRLSAEAPLAEKVALLQSAAETDSALADELFAAALGGDRDSALRDAAATLLLRCLRKPRPEPAAWERLRALVLGGRRTEDPLRLRSAAHLYAAAPADRLDSLAAEAERDPDPAFLREARRGLLRNPVPRARDLAEALSRGRGEDLEDIDVAPEGETETD